MEYLGNHFIAEFHSCDPSILDDLEQIDKIMNSAAAISGATIVRPFFHRFSPHGISGIIVVAESHFTIHTWPEHSYAAVDIFSCGTLKYCDALSYIKSSIKAAKYHVFKIRRGEITGSGEITDMLEHEPITL